MNRFAAKLSFSLLLSLSAGIAAAQPATPDATTPSSMPPGATSPMGNKAATPAKSKHAPHGASGAMSSDAMPADPQTGSTPGMPPGAKSATGNKAMTPKTPASGPM